MGIALTSEWVDKHNQRVANGRTPPVESPRAVAVAARLLVKKSTDEQKLNKLETRYLQHLRSLGHHWIGVQAITLKIADDCRLCPDFVIINADCEMEAIDTKAFFKNKNSIHVEDDAKVKMKVAARMFPFIKFFYAHEENGVWVKTPIKP